MLFACETCNAGVGRHVIDLATELAKRGHRMHLAYSRSRIDDVFRRFLQDAPGLGIALSEVPMQRALGPSDLASIKVMRRMLREEGPFDVLHAHSSKAGAVLRLAAKGGPGVRFYTPNALVTMDPKIGGRKRAVYARIERGLAKLTNRIVAVSEDERRHMLDIGLPPGQIVVVPMGTRLEPLRPRGEARVALGLSEEDFAVGLVGRLASQKAPEVAVRALGRLRESDPQVRLVMIGEGEEGAPARALAQTLGVTEKLLMPGTLDARPLMSAFDALLLTSRYESYGFVLVEAGQAGLPLVSTPTGIARDLLEGTGAGFLVSIEDDEATAEALRTLARDSGLRAQMGARAAEVACRFTPEAMALGNERAYFEALGEKGEEDGD